MNIYKTCDYSRSEIIAVAGLLYLLSYSPVVSADIIYQWTDPWGQIQYSKTPEPGSSISDLTVLPQQQKVTAQQKQKAMLQKMATINKKSVWRNQQQDYEQQMQLHNRQSVQHCRKLRNFLADVRVRNSRQYFWSRYYHPGRPYYGDIRSPDLYPDHYYYYQDQYLEQDLQREIRRFCR